MWYKDKISNVTKSHNNTKTLTNNTKQHYCTVYIEEFPKKWGGQTNWYMQLHEKLDGKPLQLMGSDLLDHGFTVKEEPVYYSDFASRYPYYWAEETWDGDALSEIKKYVFMTDDQGLNDMKITSDKFCKFLTDLSISGYGDYDLKNNLIHARQTTVEVITPFQSTVIKE